MRGSRLLIGLLVLATVLVDCAVVRLAQEHNYPHAAVILIWSLQLAQVSLAAIWLSVGGPTGPWRLVGAVAVLVAWSYAMAGLPGAPEVGAWLMWSGSQTAAISAVLLTGRSLGLRVRSSATADAAEDATDRRERLQFSILYLLGWMTALAVALGVLKYVAPFESLPFEWLTNWGVMAIFLGHAVIALAAFWAVLGTRRFVLRAGVLILSHLTAFAVLLAPTGYPLDTPSSVAMLYLLETLLLIGPLLVFRVAGYRLQVGQGK